MLLTLGIDSAFSLVEAIVTGLKDTFHVAREKVTLWVCIIGFLFGLLYTTKAGLYWLDVVDHWMNWGLVIVGLLEAVLIGWFFDIKKASEDIDSSSEMKFGGFWVICVKYITPLVLLTIITSNVIKEIQSPYEGYPVWALMAGGWILLISLLFISFFMQSLKDIPKMNAKSTRFIGHLVIYVGLIMSFYMFYIVPEVFMPLAVLIGSVAVGSIILSLGRKQGLIS